MWLLKNLKLMNLTAIYELGEVWNSVIVELRSGDNNMSQYDRILQSFNISIQLVIRRWF